MILSQIAALAKNNVIGADGDLPWNIPEDMKFFREKTSGHMILMGRKTFESFPKPLKNRLHIVITRQKNYPVPDGVEVFANIDEAFKFCKTKTTDWPEEVFIIGGGEIYQQTLSQSDRLYLTLIDQEYLGDTKYPNYEDQFILAEKEDHFEPQQYSFCLFVKKPS